MGRPQRHRSVGTGDAADTEWISRKLVSFGRYKDGRPRGLRVESDSHNEGTAFLLEDLMDEWGYDEGLSKDDVMQAVRHHMFHGNDPTSTLRFAIESTGKGAVVIRVMPRSSRGGGGGRQRGEKGGVPWHNGGGGTKRERSASPPSALKTEQKLGMGLDDLIAGDKHRGRRHTSPPRQPFAKRRRQFSPERFNYSNNSYNNNNDREVGGDHYAHNDDKKADRGASPPQRREQKDSSKRDEHSEEESLSRWVSWLLKIGYRDYDVRSDDGWSPLDEVAGAIRSKHEGYEDFTTQECQEFLNQNNDEGRFQISRGWLRKVPRANRN